MDDGLRSYVPGKPHPNMFEYLGIVDQHRWCMFLDWVRTWNDKYDNAEKVTVNQVLTAVKVLQDGLRISGQEMQPYVWYLDARWGSFEILKELHNRGFGACLSLSSKAKPQPLLAFLKADLQKHEWRTVYHTETKAQLTCLRAKKKAYLYLLSNFWSGDAEVATHHRRKPPARSYEVSAPVIQGRYNKYKCGVDLWNKQVLAYNHLPRAATLDQLMTLNFHVPGLHLLLPADKQRDAAPGLPPCAASSFRAASDAETTPAAAGSGQVPLADYQKR